MADKSKPIRRNSTQVSQFLDKVAKTPVRTDAESDGRLLFAMDATASRGTTWDRACHLQGQMFQATQGVGSLSVQLCYYRGFNEFHSSAWCSSANLLLNEMSGVRCLGGHTQINRVLQHAMKEHKRKRLKAIVFVGDAMEEAADHLCQQAGQLGVLNVPLFMFQEGSDSRVKSAYKQMAQLSGGAYSPFNLQSASELRDLLAAVAVFAAGGKSALKKLTTLSPPVALLTQQLKD
ncbi:VWA domain-containing protein [Gammaproteobacteria bacterium]|nr:VWA domain-containing protein [Gammaproteobacteria bacterium]